MFGSTSSRVTEESPYLTGLSDDKGDLNNSESLYGMTDQQYADPGVRLMHEQQTVHGRPQNSA